MSTYEKHLNAICAGTVGKTNIVGLRKAVNADIRRQHGWGTSRTCPATTHREVTALMNAIREHHPRADEALTASGLKVLRNRRYTKRWTEAQRLVIDHCTGFRLVDWYEWRGGTTPMWRAVADCGYFDFINIPWQSGGDGPTVTEGH